MVGEVKVFHVREGLLRHGKIDTLLLDPVCRIGGPNCARSEDRHVARDRADTQRLPKKMTGRSR